MQKRMVFGCLMVALLAAPSAQARQVFPAGPKRISTALKPQVELAPGTQLPRAPAIRSREEALYDLDTANLQLNNSTTMEERQAAYDLAHRSDYSLETNGLVHAILAHLALSVNRLDESVREAERSLELEPDAPQAANVTHNLALVYYVREDFKKAREKMLVAEEKLRGKPQHDKSVVALAVFEAIDGQVDLSEERLDAFLADEDAGNVLAKYQLAVVYDVTGRMEEALDLTREAASGDPDGLARRHGVAGWPELGLQNAALLAEATGNKAKAVEKWSALAQAECTGLHWKLLNGVAKEHLLRIGAPLAPCQPAVAAPALAAIVAAPNATVRPPVKVAKGLTTNEVSRIVRRHWNEIKSCQRPGALTIRPVPGVRVAVDHRALAWAALHEHRLDDALHEFQADLDLHPNDFEPHEGMAVTHVLRAELPAARAELETALRLADTADTTTRTLVALADVDLLLDQPELAEQKLNDAVASDSDNAAILYEFALLYDVTGRAQAAALMEQQALRLDPSGAVRLARQFAWPELRDHFEGLVAEAQGDRAAALKQWNALLALDTAGALHWKALQGRATAHLKTLLGAGTLPLNEPLRGSAH